MTAQPAPSLTEIAARSERLAESEPTTTILVVDDEKGPRESLKMILSPGHGVLLAEDGIGALELLRKHTIDLVTVDLNMPGMKGDELMRTIREEFPEVSVIVITGCGSVETAVEGIRYGVSDYLSKPFDVVQVTAAVSRALSRCESRKRLVGLLEGIGSALGKHRDSDDVLAELDGNDALQTQLRAALQEPVLDPTSLRANVSAAQTGEFLEVLAETIEFRDAYMRGHARRVAFYAGLLADRLSMSCEDRERVRLSSFLHDLGKVALPTEILEGKERIDADQRIAVEQHPEIGERLVRPLGFSSAVASSIRHHHERFDGTGYPDRLHGDEIPLASRVIAVADAFDAMTCDIPYAPAVSTEQAIAELRKHGGSQFDPSIVQHLASIVENSEFELSSSPRPAGGATQ
jgi:putative two-component system response regulator